MSAFAFDYSGKELAEPLAELVTALRAECAELDALHARQKDTVAAEKLPPRPGQLSAPEPEATRTGRKLEARLFELADAEFLLAECKRTPGASWQLDVYQLRWLYRFKADPRVRDRMRDLAPASPSAPRAAAQAPTP